MKIEDWLHDLTIRIYVDGALVAERCWHRHRHGDEALYRIMWMLTQISSSATRDKRPWQIELSDAGAPTTIGVVRWGTDPARMTQPVEVPGAINERIYVDGHDSALGWIDGRTDALRIRAAKHN